MAAILSVVSTKGYKRASRIFAMRGLTRFPGEDGLELDRFYRGDSIRKGVSDVYRARVISDGTEAIWKQAREIEHGGKKIDMDKANEIIQNEIEIISAIQTHGRVPKIIDSGYIYDDGKKVNVIVMERIEGAAQGLPK